MNSVLNRVAIALTVAGLTIGSEQAIASAAAKSSKPYAGQTITVVYPYNSPPQQLLNQFTAQTGINVKWVVIGWDAGYTKIASSQVAHTYLGDLTDVDWSRVGQYYAANWYLPLNQYFNVKSLSSDMPELKAFTINGKLVGIPIDGSMFMTTINKVDFQKAGIKTLPKTIAEYTADLKRLQSTHVNPHPLGIPFAAAEGLSTYWYNTTAAFGGSVLGAGNKPLFTNPKSAGYQALAWMVNAYKTGLVPAADINLTDYQVQSQLAGHTVSSELSDYSGNVATLYNNPSESKVVGQVEYIPTPGPKGESSSVVNPDGMGIPVTAKHPGAAAEFLKWFISANMQADFAGANGANNAIQSFPLPTRLSAMTQLEKKNKTTQASTMVGLFKNHSRPVFPDGGPPSWYPQFSNAVYTNIHEAALGQETVAQAIASIASTVSQLNQ